MRVLEKAGVAYQLLTFPDTLHSAEAVADHLGLARAEVYKTLVVLRSAGGKHLLVMVAGDENLNLKSLATALGERKLRMATHQEAERLTRLQVGGISALALLNRGFEILIDRAATGREQVVVSAGRRGLNLRLAVSDLMCATGARVVDAT
jgi:Cys-tRNA(Pro)/Cys-tRNA(Cys) deacylase